MLDALAGAVTAANAALDMMKRGVAARDQKVIEDAVADMTERLRAVNSNALEALQDALRSAQDARAFDKRIAELEKEIATLRAAADDRDRYRLTSLSRNTFAYTLKVQEDGPQHYLCQACYDSGKRIVLQRIGGKPFLKCSACEAQVQVDALNAEVRETTRRTLDAASGRSTGWP